MTDPSEVKISDECLEAYMRDFMGFVRMGGESNTEATRKALQRLIARRVPDAFNAGVAEINAFAAGHNACRDRVLAGQG
jgi:hypothetical protein